MPAEAHSGLVSAMCHVPSSVGADKWATVGRDGCLKLWQGKVWQPAGTQAVLCWLSELAWTLLARIDLSGVARSLLLTIHHGRPLSRLPAAQSLQPVKSLQVINAPATCVSYLQHAHALVVGSHSRRLRLFDAATYEPCGTIPKVGVAPQSATLVNTVC
jgi:hypothetical protein